MEQISRRFLCVWALSCIVLIALVFVFDGIINPYMVLDLPRIAGFNARKPSIETQGHLMKAYDVIRASPRTVLLGTSTVGLGIDANDPAWNEEARPVYNLSIRGGGPYTSYRYLQHITSHQSLDLVVMGLDFNFFLNTPDPLVAGDEFEARLALRSDGTPNARQMWQRTRDLIHATLSLEAVKDSVVTLAANFGNESPDVAAGNWENSEYFRFAAEHGDRFMDLWDRRIIALYRGKQINPRAMDAVDAIINLCRLRRIHLILFVSPVHANELEAIKMVGSWNEFENWKRDLVAMVSERPGVSRDAGVPMWDFTGYNSYTTEVPPRQGTMRWFRDSSHYDRRLGRLIIRRVLGDDSIRLGQQLTSQNLEQHLSNIRHEQGLYHERAPSRVRHVRELYESMFGHAR